VRALVVACVEKGDYRTSQTMRAILSFNRGGRSLGMVAFSDRKEMQQRLCLHGTIAPMV